MLLRTPSLFRRSSFHNSPPNDQRIGRKSSNTEFVFARADTPCTLGFTSCTSRAADANACHSLVHSGATLLLYNSATDGSSRANAPSTRSTRYTSTWADTLHGKP